MRISSSLDRLYSEAKENRWMRYFAGFNRVALAAGFIPSGMVKILGERFTDLSANHPMGHYLDAVYQTGYYYTFIGVMQVTAALLLLLPRTSTLGAFIYFPIILNICILTFSTRFDGSIFTAPLMVLANLYLLGWNYDKWKYVLPFNRPADAGPKPKPLSNKIPVKFFAGVAAAVILFVMVIPRLYQIRPRNTLAMCLTQFKSNNKAGNDFCACIHTSGDPLNKCMDEYFQAPADAGQTP